MKSKRRRSRRLTVTREAIKDFSLLTIQDRLQWLDQMRQFLSKTLPKRTQRIWNSRQL